MKPYMRHRTAVILLMAFVLALTGCRNIKDIRVLSVNLDSISMRGFKSVDLHFSAEIDNPARQIRLTEIDGSIIHSGKIIGKLAMDSFILAPKSQETYNLKANVSLAQGAGLKDLMMLADPKRLNECTVDLSAKAAYGKGTPMPVKRKNIPLKELLNSIENEKN